MRDKHKDYLKKQRQLRRRYGLNLKTRRKKNGCYVATSVYGSYDCPQVWVLRRYRDMQLAKFWYGRLFIIIYYAISPTLVAVFGDTVLFKNLFQKCLDRIVDKLAQEGYSSQPYEDQEW